MKKNFIKKSIIALLPMAFIAVPLASCARQTTSNTIDGDNGNNGWTPPFGSGNNIGTHFGTIDKKITDDISKPVKIDVLDLSTKTGVNSYQSISNFLKYNLDRNYNNNLITKDGIKKDAYSFADRIFKLNNKLFSIDLKTEPTIKILDSSEKNGNKNKKVSVNLPLIIRNENNSKQTFKLLSNSYDLNANSEYNLVISFNDQNPNYLINSINNRYFLGIGFDNVNFKLTSDSGNDIADFSLNNFTFTSNQFSYNFKKEFLYLTNKSDYKDVINDNSISSILNSKTDEEFKKELQNEFVKSQNNYFEIIKIVNQLLKSLVNNESVEDFLTKNTANVLTVLSQFNVINLNKNIQVLITDLLNKNKSVVQSLQDNKQAIIDLVKSIVGNNQLILGVAESIVDSIKPDLTQQEQNDVVEQLKSVINLIGSSANKYLFIVDLVKNILSGQNVYQFIKEAVKKQEVKDLINQLPANIKPAVQLLIDVIEKNGTTKSLIDIIFEDKDKLVNIIKSFVNNETVKKILDIAIKNNNNFNKENVKAIITKTLYGLTNGIISNLDSSVNNFKDFKFDKTKKEFTFTFSSIYKVNKDFKWELKPIIDILPDTFSLKDFGLDVASIEKKVESTSGGLITLNKDSGKEWYVFKKSELLGFIPSYVDFKVGDSLEFRNIAKNQQIWLNPQNVGSKNYFGYSVPTISGFRLNLPGGVQSIFGQYKNKDNGIDFTKLFAEFLTQEHNYYQNVSVINNDKEITNDLVYDNNLYMNNIPFEWKININKTFKEKVKSKSEKVVIETYKAKTSDQNEISINSYYLSNKLTQEELGNDLIKDYDKVFKGSQYKPFIMVNQISNFDSRTIIVPLKVKLFVFDSSININLNVSNYTFLVSAYLPFKTYDSKKNKFSNYLHSQTGSYLKAGVTYTSLVNETFYDDWIV